MKLKLFDEEHGAAELAGELLRLRRELGTATDPLRSRAGKKVLELFGLSPVDAYTWETLQDLIENAYFELVGPALDRLDHLIGDLLEAPADWIDAVDLDDFLDGDLPVGKAIERIQRFDGATSAPIP